MPERLTLNFWLFGDDKCNDLIVVDFGLGVVVVVVVVFCNDLGVGDAVFEFGNEDFRDDNEDEDDGEDEDEDLLDEEGFEVRDDDDDDDGDGDGDGDEDGDENEDDFDENRVLSSLLLSSSLSLFALCEEDREFWPDFLSPFPCIDELDIADRGDIKLFINAPPVSVSDFNWLAPPAMILVNVFVVVVSGIDIKSSNVLTRPVPLASALFAVEVELGDNISALHIVVVVVVASNNNMVANLSKYLIFIKLVFIALHLFTLGWLFACLCLLFCANFGSDCRQHILMLVVSCCFFFFFFRVARYLFSLQLLDLLAVLVDLICFFGLKRAACL